MSSINDANASYKLLSRELKKHGFTFRSFNLSGRRVMALTSPKGRTWTSFAGKISYPLNAAFHTDVSRSKELSAELAKKAGFSVAFTKSIARDESLCDKSATELLDKYNKLIVKPESASLSNGLTLNISDPKELQDAISYAKSVAKNSLKVLVQQQIFSEEIRFLVIEGKVVGALLREKPKLVGDGLSTLGQLLKAENDSRQNVKDTMVEYPTLTANMFEQPTDLEYVLEEGDVYEINKSTMIRGGASIYNISDEIHPSYVNAIEDLVQKFGSGFVVVDVFIRDYRQPMTKQNAYFNEFNTAPVLKLCYSCRNGKHIDIVPTLVEAVERRINS